MEEVNYLKIQLTGYRTEYSHELESKYPNHEKLLELKKSIIFYERAIKNYYLCNSKEDLVISLIILLLNLIIWGSVFLWGNTSVFLFIGIPFLGASLYCIYDSFLYYISYR